jgi:hypothetical protein
VDGGFSAEVGAKRRAPRGVVEGVMPSLPRNPPIKTPLDERWYIPLSSVQSLYIVGAKVIITHTPSTSDACEMHAQPVEKSIASLALRFC